MSSVLRPLFGLILRCTCHRFMHWFLWTAYMTPSPPGSSTHSRKVTHPRLTRWAEKEIWPMRSNTIALRLSVKTGRFESMCGFRTNEWPDGPFPNVFAAGPCVHRLTVWSPIASSALPAKGNRPAKPKPFILDDATYPAVTLECTLALCRTSCTTRTLRGF